MRTIAPILVGLLTVWGCSASNPESKGNAGAGGGNNPGTGGTSNGGNGPGTGGIGGTNTAKGGGPGNGGMGNGGTSNPGTGGSNPGTGGTSTGPTGGTGTATGGSGGAAPQCISDITNLVNKNGWVCDLDTAVKMQGAWYGYGDGTSCTPDKNICTSGSCCITGKTVTPDANFTQWGCGIGLELNSTGGDNPVKTVYSGPVKCFEIELTGSSGKNPVRIGFTQGTDTTGKVSPFNEIPAFTSGWKGQLCFTDAECADWATKAGTCAKPVGTAGTPFDMQFQVSAGTTTASDFNVCVSKLTPVTDGAGGGGGGATSSCTTATNQGTITEQYGTVHVTCNSKDYIIQNNAWGITNWGSQVEELSFGPGTKFKVTKQTGTGANGAPASYPSVFLGANGGRSTTNSGLPKAVSSITKTGVPTAWTWAANGATGSYNAAYDVWFSSGSGGDPSASAPSGGYLMVWYHKPTDNQPIGESKATAVIAGKNWSVWYGTNSGSQKPCVSYVAQQDVSSLSFNLGEFIRDAVDKQYLQDSWYLTNVFAGFEIWSGGTGLETTDFFVDPSK